MSLTSNSTFSLFVNSSHDSFSQPIPPPNTPVPFPDEPPSYEQSNEITAEHEINRLNTYDFGCLTPFLGVREEPNNQIFYDPTEPYPIFPFVRNRTHNLPLKHFPHFADQLPLGFSNEDWERVWNANMIDLTTYLTHTQVTHNNILVPWTNEHDYHGVSYRLTIDHESPFHRLPRFTHGTTVSFQDCNSSNFRYIVDHCVYQDKTNAYLKVICFDFSQHWYDICSYRPPLILVIPRSHSNVRMHPYLTPFRHRSSRRIYTRTEEEIINELLNGYHGNHSRSLWDRLFCH